MDLLRNVYLQSLCQRYFVRKKKHVRWWIIVLLIWSVAQCLNVFVREEPTGCDSQRLRTFVPFIIIHNVTCVKHNVSAQENYRIVHSRLCSVSRISSRECRVTFFVLYRSMIPVMGWTLFFIIYEQDYSLNALMKNPVEMSKDYSTDYQINILLVQLKDCLVQLFVWFHKNIFVLRKNVVRRTKYFFERTCLNYLIDLIKLLIQLHFITVSTNHILPCGSCTVCCIFCVISYQDI